MKSNVQSGYIESIQSLPEIVTQDISDGLTAIRDIDPQIKELYNSYRGRLRTLLSKNQSMGYRLKDAKLLADVKPKFYESSIRHQEQIDQIQELAHEIAQSTSDLIYRFESSVSPVVQMDSSGQNSVDIRTITPKSLMRSYFYRIRNELLAGAIRLPERVGSTEASDRWLSLWDILQKSNQTLLSKMQLGGLARLHENPVPYIEEVSADEWNGFVQIPEIQKLLNEAKTYFLQGIVIKWSEAHSTVLLFRKHIKGQAVIYDYNTHIDLNYSMKPMVLKIEIPGAFSLDRLKDLTFGPLEPPENYLKY